MKTVEAILHELYAANSHLTAMVPAEDFVTGIAGDRDLPYATMSREGGAPKTHSNANRLNTASIRIQLWIESHETGSAFRDLLIESWHNQSLSSGDARVLMIRYVNDLAIQEEDGVWQFLIDFDVTTQAL